MIWLSAKARKFSMSKLRAFYLSSRTDIEIKRELTDNKIVKK